MIRWSDVPDADLIKAFLERTDEPGKRTLEQRAAALDVARSQMQKYVDGFAGPLRRGTREKFIDFLSRTDPNPAPAAVTLSELLGGEGATLFAPPSEMRDRVDDLLPNLEAFGRLARNFLRAWALKWLLRGRPEQMVRELAQQLAGVLVASGVANLNGPGPQDLQDAEQVQVLAVIAAAIEEEYHLDDPAHAPAV